MILICSLYLVVYFNIHQMEPQPLTVATTTPMTVGAATTMTTMLVGE